MTCCTCHTAHRTGLPNNLQLAHLQRQQQRAKVQACLGSQLHQAAWWCWQPLQPKPKRGRDGRLGGMRIDIPLHVSNHTYFTSFSNRRAISSSSLPLLRRSLLLHLIRSSENITCCTCHAAHRTGLPNILQQTHLQRHRQRAKVQACPVSQLHQAAWWCWQPLQH